MLQIPNHTDAIGAKFKQCQLCQVVQVFHHRNPVVDEIEFSEVRCLEALWNFLDFVEREIEMLQRWQCSHLLHIDSADFIAVQLQTLQTQQTIQVLQPSDSILSQTQNLCSHTHVFFLRSGGNATTNHEHVHPAHTSKFFKWLRFSIFRNRQLVRSNSTRCSPRGYPPPIFSCG